jgi:transposase
MMKYKNTSYHCTPRQGFLPLCIASYLPIDDPVFEFDHLMEAIGLRKYLPVRSHCSAGRIGYNPVILLKLVLFGFMLGYCSLRSLEKACRTDLRFIYLSGGQAPSYHTFENFINKVLANCIEDIFNAVNAEIFKEDHVDLTYLYIDGTKMEANANKYSWVWKKTAIKSRYHLYEKITSLLNEINCELATDGAIIETSTEYVPDYLEEKLEALERFWELDEKEFVHGPGHRKTPQQRMCEKLKQYTDKLREYGEKIRICGPDRNSYSKTDPSATFMRVKKDYVGNDQLLPAYNVQFGIADEYIAVLDVSQCRSDMDCFIPLMEKFHKTYHFYPKYPVADAGYGSFNNYIYCEQHGMKKFMKFPMFKKQTSDAKYRDNPFRAENFAIDANGIMHCPFGRAFRLQYRKPIPGNHYGRQEEVYQCEDCSGCPYAEKCKRTPKNRTVQINQELTSMHKEVIANLESIQGALLRMNRSIQSEGTFGIIKNDHGYKRIVRRGTNPVKVEIYLIAIGQNLNKHYHKRMRMRRAT